MKFPRRTGFALLTLLALFGAVFLGCGDGTQNKKSATFQDLVKSGFLAEGWIPDCLPKNAREIIESHLRTSKASWVSFQIDKAGMGDFKTHLTIMPNLGPLLFGGVSVSQAPYWWPKTPPGSIWSLDCGEKTPTGIWYVSLDESNVQAYLWRNP
jgi:hypothetical protein